jgi:hypothetical protein
VVEIFNFWFVCIAKTNITALECSMTWGTVRVEVIQVHMATIESIAKPVQFRVKYVLML